jgi:hypothetical protein
MNEEPPPSGSLVVGSGSASTDLGMDSLAVESSSGAVPDAVSDPPPGGLNGLAAPSCTTNVWSRIFTGGHPSSSSNVGGSSELADNPPRLGEPEDSGWG